MYECVILRVIKMHLGHSSNKCIYLTKNAKNMNDPYTTRVKVTTLAYAAQPVAV